MIVIVWNTGTDLNYWAGEDSGWAAHLDDAREFPTRADAEYELPHAQEYARSGQVEIREVEPWE